MGTPRFDGDPVAVWDTREPDGLFNRNADACGQYASQNFPANGAMALRAEFHQAGDGKWWALLYEFELDDGNIRADPRTQQPILREPVAVPLPQPPADRLLGR